MIRNLCYFLISLFLLGMSGNKKFVKSGDEFKNDGKEDSVYLLLPIKPGEIFKNTTDKNFRVLSSAQDFLELNKQLKIDFLIETASAIVGAKIDSLQTLQDKLESQQAERQKIDQQK